MTEYQDVYVSEGLVLRACGDLIVAEHRLQGTNVLMYTTWLPDPLADSHKRHFEGVAMLPVRNLSQKCYLLQSEMYIPANGWGSGKAGKMLWRMTLRNLCETAILEAFPHLLRLPDHLLVKAHGAFLQLGQPGARTLEGESGGDLDEVCSRCGIDHAVGEH